MSSEIALVEKTSKGVLSTNIDDVESYVLAKLEEYTPEKYAGDSDAAKKDRSTLNSSKKALTAERIRIVKAAMDRFGISELETRCKKVEKDIDTAAAALDVIAKVKEEAEKKTKRDNIELYFSSKKFTLLSLDRLFDQRWLNKTVKLAEVKKEIDAAIEKIYADVKTLEALEDADVLKQLYLDTLDIGAALRKGQELADYRKRLEVEAKERAEREARAQIQKQADEIQEEKARPVEPENLAAAALGKEVDPDPEMEYTLCFKARKSTLLRLREYMTAQGIQYIKIGG